MQFPEIGEVFEGRYEILDVLGQGGFAIVVRARDTQLGRDVALKLLRPRDGRYSPRRVQRYMREARVVAELQHPNTIRMFDFGQHESGLLYMVLEYVAGEDLSKLLARAGNLPLETAVHVVKQVIAAMVEAHAAGVLHRDIKPANVLIYEYDGDAHRAKLLDFGLAKADELEESASSGLTTRGDVVGTPAYMAPEQMFNGDVGPATDVYGIGLLLVEMLSGRETIDLLHKHVVRLHTAGVNAYRLPQDLAPPAYRSVIVRAIAPDPKDRYQSVNALAEGLRNAAEGRRATPVPARPAPRRGPLSGEFPVVKAAAKPNKGMIFALIGILALIASAALVIMLLSSDEPPPRRVVPRAPNTSINTVPEEPEPPDEEQVEADPKQVAAEVAAEIPDGGTPGCGRPAPFRGLDELVGELTGLQRSSWSAYIPTSYDPAKKSPLIMMFHATREHPARFLEYSGFIELADKHGIVLIAPRDRSPGFLPAWVDRGGRRSKMNVVRSALEDAQAMLCIDRAKIFALGNGTGGFAAERLPCEVPDFDAIATTGFRHRQGWDTQVCTPQQPMPYMYVAPMSDPYLPLEGGATCASHDLKVPYAHHVGMLVDGWKCDQKSKQWSKPDGGTCHEYRGCKQDLVVCEVEGGRHWNDISRLAHQQVGQRYRTRSSCEERSSMFPYAQQIWKFFESHPDNGSRKKSAPASDD